MLKCPKELHYKELFESTKFDLIKMIFKVYLFGVLSRTKDADGNGETFFVSSQQKMYFAKKGGKRDVEWNFLFG